MLWPAACITLYVHITSTCIVFCFYYPTSARLKKSSIQLKNFLYVYNLRGQHVLISVQYSPGSAIHDSLRNSGRIQRVLLKFDEIRSRNHLMGSTGAMAQCLDFQPKNKNFGQHGWNTHHVEARRLWFQSTRSSNAHDKSDAGHDTSLEFLAFRRDLWFCISMSVLVIELQILWLHRRFWCVRVCN